MPWADNYSKKKWYWRQTGGYFNPEYSFSHLFNPAGFLCLNSHFKSGFGKVIQGKC